MAPANRTRTKLVLESGRSSQTLNPVSSAGQFGGIKCTCHFYPVVLPLWEALIYYLFSKRFYSKFLDLRSLLNCSSNQIGNRFWFSFSSMRSSIPYLNTLKELPIAENFIRPNLMMVELLGCRTETIVIFEPISNIFYHKTKRVSYIYNYCKC